MWQQIFDKSMPPKNDDFILLDEIKLLWYLVWLLCRKLCTLQFSNLCNSLLFLNVKISEEIFKNISSAHKYYTSPSSSYYASTKYKLAAVTHSDTEDAAVSTHWSVIRDPAEKVSTAVNQGQLPGAASQTPVMLLLFTALLPHADKEERAQLNRSASTLKPLR